VRHVLPIIQAFLTALVLMCLTQFEAHCDDYTLYGVLPFVSKTGKVTDTFDYNLFASTTYNFRNTTFKGRDIPERDTQLYIQPSLIYKYSPDLNLALGYVFQRNNPFSSEYSNENRLWQQILGAHDLKGGRMTHRVRYEERFIHNTKTGGDPLSTRVRYQLGYSIPLEGKELDPGEFYLNSFNEFYFSLTGQKNATYSENWTYVGIGYLIPGVGKIEMGPLYQTVVVDKEGDRRDYVLWQLGFTF